MLLHLRAVVLMSQLKEFTGHMQALQLMRK